MANVVIGYLAATPELLYTESGTAYAHVVILRNRRRKVGDEWVKIPTPVRHEYTVWAEFAENVVATLKKGMRVVAIVSDQHSKAFKRANGELDSAMTGRLEEIGQAVGKYAPKDEQSSAPTQPTTGTAQEPKEATPAKAAPKRASTPAKKAAAKTTTTRTPRTRKAATA